MTELLHISIADDFQVSQLILIHFQGISSNSDKRFAHFMTEQLQISIVDDFQVS